MNVWRVHPPPATLLFSTPACQMPKWVMESAPSTGPFMQLSSSSGPSDVDTPGIWLQCMKGGKRKGKQKADDEYKIPIVIGHIGNGNNKCKSFKGKDNNIIDGFCYSRDGRIFEHKPRYGDWPINMVLPMKHHERFLACNHCQAKVVWKPAMAVLSAALWENGLNKKFGLKDLLSSHRHVDIGFCLCNQYLCSYVHLCK